MPKADMVPASNPREVVAAWVSSLRLAADASVEQEFDPSTILSAILEAEDFDAAVAAQQSGILSGKGLVGMPHHITRIDWRISDDKYASSDRSLGVWAFVHAERLEDRSDCTYGIGASNVLAILYQADRFGKIPGDFVIKSKEAKNGDVLFLYPYKATTVKG